MRRIELTVVSVAIAFLTLGEVAAHDGPHGGPDEVTFRVGKNGEINLRQDLKFGTSLVKKGKYAFEHRLDGDRHLVVLTEVARKDGASPVAYELPTRLIPAQKAANRTSLYAREATDRSLVVTMVEIAGEASEHLPQT
jgi:hypothetical protein